MPTKIEWATETWNPITGCTPTSVGCENCYAKRMANRLKGRYGYPIDDPFKVTCQWKSAVGVLGRRTGKHELTYPRQFKKSSMIFVCSMGDLFHEKVTHEMFMPIWQMIESLPQHTFLILTKRPKIMSFRLFNWCFGTGPVGYLPNVWLGFTAETQKLFDERWKYASKTPASVIFVSYEPALGSLVLPQDFLERGKKALVICGGETGPGARPMRPNWPRSIRDQCKDAEVKFFFKSWGEWWQPPSGKTEALADFKKSYYDHESGMFRIGKKKAGRLLDGKIHSELPEVKAK